jgi:hypothetical protein
VNQDRPQRSDEAILEFGSGARQTDRALASFGSKANFAGMAASGAKQPLTEATRQTSCLGARAEILAIRETCTEL